MTFTFYFEWRQLPKKAVNVLYTEQYTLAQTIIFYLFVFAKGVDEVSDWVISSHFCDVKHFIICFSKTWASPIHSNKYLSQSMFTAAIGEIGQPLRMHYEY